MKRSREDPWNIIMGKLQLESVLALRLVCKDLRDSGARRKSDFFSVQLSEIDLPVYKELKPRAHHLKKIVVLSFSDYLMELLKFCPNLEVFHMPADEDGTDD